MISSGPPRPLSYSEIVMAALMLPRNAHVHGVWHPRVGGGVLCGARWHAHRRRPQKSGGRHARTALELLPRGNATDGRSRLADRVRTSWARCSDLRQSSTVSAAAINRAHIIDGPDRRGETPAQGRHLINTMRGLSHWAADVGYVRANDSWRQIPKRKSAGFPL
jgi:hypothetical protein